MVPCLSDSVETASACSTPYVKQLAESASMVTETSSEIQTEEPEPHSCTKFSKTFIASRGLQRHFSSKHNNSCF